LKAISKNLCEHKNELMANGQPIKQRQYYMNPNYTQWVWEDLDIPWMFYLSHSALQWLSPLLIVPNKFMASYVFMWINESLMHKPKKTHFHYPS
jgi:hypothetical protein